MSEVTHELSINRFVEATPEKVWQVMTERLPEWWCPKPWKVEVENLEWRSGGPFETTMFGPEGEEIPNRGVFLEVTPNRRLVFTDAVNAQWDPQTPFMIGIIAIEAEGKGTRYTASARHWDEQAMKQHEEMGFIDGWRAVADQLAALAQASD